MRWWMWLIISTISTAFAAFAGGYFIGKMATPLHDAQLAGIQYIMRTASVTRRPNGGLTETLNVGRKHYEYHWPEDNGRGPMITETQESVLAGGNDREWDFDDIDKLDVEIGIAEGGVIGQFVRAMSRLPNGEKSSKYLPVMLALTASTGAGLSLGSWAGHSAKTKLDEKNLQKALEDRFGWEILAIEKTRTCPIVMPLAGMEDNRSDSGSTRDRHPALTKVLSFCQRLSSI